MKYLRFSWRFTFSCLHVLLAVILCQFLGTPNERGFSHFQQRVIRWLVRTQLRLLNVRVHIRGTPADDAPLIVSNHISWVDILVILSVRPSRFLSKVEVAKWFFIGNISRHFGTLFIQRGDGGTDAVRAISKSLVNQTSTAIFPEGTTSDGTQIKRFYPRLFAASIETKTKIQPITLFYPDTHNQYGINPQVPFVREISLLRHAVGLLLCKEIPVTITLSEPVDFANHTRDSLAQLCHQKCLENLPQKADTSI